MTDAPEGSGMSTPPTPPEETDGFFCDGCSAVITEACWIGDNAYCAACIDRLCASYYQRANKPPAASAEADPSRRAAPSPPPEGIDALIASAAAFMWEHHPRRDECTVFGTSIEFWSEEELRQRMTFAFDEARGLDEAGKRRSPPPAPSSSTPEEKAKPYVHLKVAGTPVTAWEREIQAANDADPTPEGNAARIAAAEAVVEAAVAFFETTEYGETSTRRYYLDDREAVFLAAKAYAACWPKAATPPPAPGSSTPEEPR